MRNKSNLLVILTLLVLPIGNALWAEECKFETCKNTALGACFEACKASIESRAFSLSPSNDLSQQIKKLETIKGDVDKAYYKQSWLERVSGVVFNTPSSRGRNTLQFAIGSRLKILVAINEAIKNKIVSLPTALPPTPINTQNSIADDDVKRSTDGVYSQAALRGSQALLSQVPKCDVRLDEINQRAR